VHEFALIRVYLDSNVLFSASYSERNRSLDFWRLERVIPVTSPYAVEEVRGNLRQPGHFARFDALLLKTELVSDFDVRFIPSGVTVVEKDRPILASAIGSRVDYLVTGDKNHFKHLYGNIVEKVYISSPSDFLDRHVDRLID